MADPAALDREMSYDGTHPVRQQRQALEEAYPAYEELALSAALPGYAAGRAAAGLAEDIPEGNWGSAALNALDLASDAIPGMAALGAIPAVGRRVAKLTPEQADAQKIIDLLAGDNSDEVTDAMLNALTPEGHAYLYDNYDLPMDTASRMARAREMGFDVDSPAYHGTDQDIAAFRATPPPNWMTPPGVFLAGDKTPGAGAAEASGYAMTPRTGDAAQAGLGGNVLPVASRAEAPFSIGQTDGGYAQLRDVHSAILKEEGLGWGDAEELWKHTNERTGADAYVDANTPADFQYARYNKQAVQDPAKIRSRHARFDPRLKGLTNLMAGGAGLAYLAPEVAAYLGGEGG